MPWDPTTVSVVLPTANFSEGAEIHVPPNPLTPPISGTNANGNLTGFNYDGENFSSLPFRPQFVTYFKDGYREYRTFDGNGNWSGPTSFYGSYASGAVNVCDVAMPWNAIIGNNGLPMSFVFVGFLTSISGLLFVQGSA